MALVLGVDGCPGGWCCVPIHTGRDRCAVREPALYASFDAVLAAEADVICVDIPIGLPEGRGRRRCDELAQNLMSSKKPSVFLPPMRQVLRHADFAAFLTGAPTPQVERIRLHRLACDITERMIGERLLSIQAFSISPKIHEVDQCISPTHQHARSVPRVCEVHPELCFRALNGDEIVLSKKSEEDGQRERWELLLKVLRTTLPDKPSLLPWPKSKCALDDYIDALVCAWTAVCIFRDEAQPIPKNPPTDDRGLRMEMWYPAP
jgi:predicted RNase H-like nuclease